MTITYPQPIKFHKKVAQLQVDLIRPKEEKTPDGKSKISEGCLMLSIAREMGDGSGRMNWNDKILLKLSSTDLTNILCGMKLKQFPIKLIHKFNGNTSYLDVSQGERPGTYKWMIGKTQGDNKKYASIYLDSKDMYYLSVMMESSLPVTLGWIS